MRHDHIIRRLLKLTPGGSPLIDVAENLGSTLVIYNDISN
jgi:hypothetical protein